MANLTYKLDLKEHRALLEAGRIGCKTIIVTWSGGSKESHAAIASKLLTEVSEISCLHMDRARCSVELLIGIADPPEPAIASVVEIIKCHEARRIRSAVLMPVETTCECDGIGPHVHGGPAKPSA